ncbi:hypothetical protein N5C66_05925 [Rhizobium pusense]|uniref:hypothetical protein n=1 Tax=Agrobacterium pusense TaxID=648995 RepID=UPI002447E2E9|nr:hypothetical protein [Agrobacterium pusense]MDH1097435.1 hypothetical protein [Agrobacterium pusense]MDH1111265.1 hypothetical protein [Agrobacterium pusense]MDH2193468.1 hypothetical protein [Agrobacterium pusense]
MTSKRQIPAAFAKGYVLCSPSGKLQQQTWSATAAKAIASKYRKRETWEKAQRRGWSVQFVYARFFVPVFKSTFTTTEISEAYDAEDI